MEDKARIQELVNELDGLIPSDGAVVRIYDGDFGGDDSGPHSLEVQGTPAGYLQVGVAFLQAAFTPAAGNPSLDGDEIYDEMPDWVVDDEHSYRFGRFRRWDNPPALPRKEGSGWAQGLMGFGCLGVVGIVLVLSCIGLQQVVRSL